MMERKKILKRRIFRKNRHINPGKTQPLARNRIALESLEPRVMLSSSWMETGGLDPFSEGGSGDLSVTCYNKEISIDDVSLLEGDSGVTLLDFTVSLSDATWYTIKVDYQTADDTAHAGSDYQPVSGTLVFCPGQTSKSIQIPILGDTNIEPDEMFFVNLSDPCRAKIADEQGIGTIINDDVVVPNITIDDVSVHEGDSGASDAHFMVSLSAPTSMPVTVDYHTADESALAGSDYQTAAGTLTFAPGETSLMISVPVFADTVVEADETFQVNLSNPGNATIIDPQGQATIIDDDIFTISIDDMSIAEGDAGVIGAVFTVTLSTPSGVMVTVDFSTADDTATAGMDYVAVNGTLTFPPGVASQIIQVPILGDMTVEPDETFYVNLTNANNGIINDDQTQGTILNDDSPGLSIDDQSEVEGGDVILTVSLSSTPLTEVTVDYSTANDTALAGDDYQLTSGTLTFAAGQTTQTIQIPIIDDTDVEPDETFYVNLYNSNNAHLIDDQGLATIISDDVAIRPPEITVLLDGSEVMDGQDSPIIDFGTVIENQYESHLSFLVRNDGDETLTLGDIILPAGYSLSEGLAASLEAGEYDSFTVQLDTAIVGIKSGEISFANNDSDENPYNFAITGAVIGPEISLFIGSTELYDEQTDIVNFGSVLVGAADPELTFTIRNDGDYMLLLDNIALPNGISFGADPLIDSLTPGQSDTFTLVMTSEIIATYFGPMIITSNDSDEASFEVPLGGVIWDVISGKPGKTIVRFADRAAHMSDVLLKGPGSMEIQSSQLALPAVELTDTTVKSKLFISGTHKQAESMVFDITTDGSLKMIKGKKTDLQGDIDVTGSLSKLLLDDIHENSSVTTGDSDKGFRIKADDLAEDVAFDIADRLINFKTSTYIGGSVIADTIQTLRVRFDALGADVTSRLGEITTIHANKTIEGNIISEIGIGKVISKSGGLSSDASIIAQNGDINKARFAGDVAGDILAQGQLINLTGKSGTLSGAVRAYDRIGIVRFDNITDAVISSFGDIETVLSKNSIADSFILAGYDIGPDGQLGGPVDDVLNPDGALIHTVKTASTGNFDRSFALAGVQPYFDPATDSWGIAPSGQEVLASLGEILNVRLGQIWQGDADDPYGLFAATHVGKVKFAEVLTGSGAPDFQVWP